VKTWLTLMLIVLVAAVIVAIGLMREDEPSVEAKLTLDADAGQWTIDGTVTLPREGTLHLFGSEWRLAKRTAPFTLSFPADDASISTAEYEPQAIESARELNGQWRINYLAIVFSWLFTFALIAVLWLIVLGMRARPSPTGKERP
jgi:hypothetical protein